MLSGGTGTIFASETFTSRGQRAEDTLDSCNSINAVWVVPSGQIRPRMGKSVCAVPWPKNLLSVTHVIMTKVIVSGQHPVERFAIWRPRSAIGSALVRGASPSSVTGIKVREVGYRLPPRSSLRRWSHQKRLSPTTPRLATVVQ